jgi:hypothetical protein
MAHKMRVLISSDHFVRNIFLSDKYVARCVENYM